MEDVVKKIIDELKGDTKEDIKISVMRILPNQSKQTIFDLWKEFITQSIGSEILSSNNQYIAEISFINARTLKEKVRGNGIISIIWIDVGQKNEFRLDLTNDKGDKHSFIICRI